MTKKLTVLFLAVIAPIILIQLYNYYFQYAGNWLEDYQNYFKLGFLVISILGTGWLALMAKKDKSYIWLGFSIILLTSLLFYLYFAVAIINTSF
jgi:hypothetical protein